MCIRDSFKIDHEGFKAAMKEQQDRARASVVKGGSMGMQNETLAKDVYKRQG